MKIVSILVGKPQTVLYRDQPVNTGIFKDAVLGPVLLKTLNLEGDGQADLKVHGGPDKALYAYSLDAYPQWRELRPADRMDPGAMGENITIENLPETTLCVGDTFRLGKSVVQVAQARLPCYKLAVKFNDPSIVKQFLKLARPGIYFRVLEEGVIGMGDELLCLSLEKTRLPIIELYHWLLGAPMVPDRLRELFELASLPAELRAKMRSRLARS